MGPSAPLLLWLCPAVLAHRAPAAASCGAPPQPLNTSTPNALIIGDSISMGFGVSASDTGYGYGLNVRKMLGGPFTEFYSHTLAGGLATVQHSGGFGSNGGDSANGAACIDHWLGGQRWDAVTVNFGLHDCDPGRDSRGYAANLETILSKARAAAGSVIFVTTTPFHQYKAYSYSCVLRFNALARQVVAKLNAARPSNSTIRIADLFGHVERYCGANYTRCPIQLNDNLHFSTAWTPPFSVDKVTHKPLQDGPQPSGQQYTGLLVAREIARALPAAKIQPPINASRSRPELRQPSGGLMLREEGGACGLPPTPLNKSLPNVLIIGDSVSDSGSGYGPLLRNLLETDTGNGNAVGNNPRNNGPLASVQHNGGWTCAKPPAPVMPGCRAGANEQAGPTTNGVACIDSWLGAEKSWEVVTLNSGIHDCWARQFVNETAYVANLLQMHSKISAALSPTGKMLWVSTTPIASNCSAPVAGKPFGPGNGPCCECCASAVSTAFAC